MCKRKIGICGGTFNPIHVGHLILAENAYEQLGLDKVVFMPTGISYLKPQDDILSGELRAKLIDIAIKDNEHFCLSMHEVNKGGNSYTNETLSEIRILHPDDEIYFLCGEDTLYSIETWAKPEVIFANCRLVVARRGADSNDEMYSKATALKDKFNADIIFLNTSNIEIASREIRSRISEGRSVKYYLPAEVEKYIINNKLYK